MKQINFIFLIVMFSQALLASDLSVIVLEKGSGDPVSDAIVVFEKNEESAVTNERGAVSFEQIKLPDNLKILNPGFNTFFQAVLNETNKLVVYLEPISSEGEEIVVTEARIEEKTSKVTLSVAEITTIPGTGGDPLKVVESLPGVVVASNSGGGPPGGGFYIRGSDQNENTVWVNRTPIGYLYHFGGLYSTINPSLLSDFNIFLGGYPVEYNDVLGGVIDVKLRSPEKDRLHQKYSLGTYQSSVFLEGPIGSENSKHGFFFAARRSYIDFLLSPETLTSFIQNDEDKQKPEEEKNKIVRVPVFHDIQAIWEYDSPVGLIRSSYFEASDKFKAIFNQNRILDPQSAGEFGLSSGYRSLSVTWEKSWNAKVFHTMPIVLSQNNTRLQLGTDTDGSPFFFDLESKELFIQPEIRLLTSTSQQWIFGSQFIYARTPIDAKISREASESDIGETDFTTQKKLRVDRVFNSGSAAPYVKYMHFWSELFKTTLGLRYSYVKVTGGAEFKALLPRFNYEYEFRKNTWFTGAWGRYVQLPRGSELAVGTGNPDLAYTKAEHRIIGLKYKPWDVWTYQLEFFQKPMSSLVVPIDENQSPDNFSNEGRGEAYGVDFLVKRDLSRGMTGWLSYSYIHTTRTGRDGITRPFSGDQPQTLTFLWSQKLSGSWRKWTLGYRFQWHSGLPYDPVIGKEDIPIEGSDKTRPVPVYPNTKNSDRLPDFYQLDFRAERKFLFNTWKMSIYLDIQNILNTKNVTGYDYGENYKNIDNPKSVSGSVLFPAFGIEAEF